MCVRTCLNAIFNISTVSLLKALLQETCPCQILYEEKSSFLYAKDFHGLENVVGIAISIMI